MFFCSCSNSKLDVTWFSGDITASWNKRIMEVAVAEDRLLTLKGVRTAAIMHIAIHDALNTIHPVFDRYIYAGESPGANPVAAAAQAAYEVAVSQYPDQNPIFLQDLKNWLKTVEGQAGLEQAKSLGSSAAKAILKTRTADGWNTEAAYEWHPMEPGVYAEFNEHSGTPEGFVFGAGWAMATPFMLKTQDQFRSPPPPPIASDEYVKAYNEVKEVGSYQSSLRTADQTHFAMWWKDFVENSHNRLARDLTAKEQLNLWDTSRLFALINMSVIDAYINVFENKFFYNHWRPYTAIRWAEHDGNPQTVPDTGWNNLHKHTYAFPSYPSAHGCASAAAMTVLENTFGDPYPFNMTITEVDAAGPFSEKIKTDPPTRSFTSFDEAAMECSMSRVYLGIHFRYDSVEGKLLGKKIGDYTLANFLTPAEQ